MNKLIDIFNHTGGKMDFNVYTSNSKLLATTFDQGLKIILTKYMYIFWESFHAFLTQINQEYNNSIGKKSQYLRSFIISTSKESDYVV